ncbi:MAG: phytanoyl-CoA dioxygenase family protein [Bacteroidota bacterium]
MEKTFTNYYEKGYQVIPDVFSAAEVAKITMLLVEQGVAQKFGIREFLIKYPVIGKQVLSPRLLGIVKAILPNCHQLIKSIYFDKPPNANWIVNWHQDLTINLKAKRESPEFKNWRVLEERVVVQPSRAILEGILTVRIHLDDCTRVNGALRVIEGSHQQGVIDVKEWIKDKPGKEVLCEVPSGGVFLMHPLLLHASRRTENEQNRRVLHLEFCADVLPEGLAWKEAVVF